jgi:hypothetical protein
MKTVLSAILRRFVHRERRDDKTVEGFVENEFKPAHIAPVDPTR